MTVLTTSLTLKIPFYTPYGLTYGVTVTLYDDGSGTIVAPFLRDFRNKPPTSNIRWFLRDMNIELLNVSVHFAEIEDEIVCVVNKAYRASLMGLIVE